MKKILVFLCTCCAAMSVSAQNPPQVFDENNSCRDRGVAVSATSTSVKVDVPVNNDNFSRSLKSDVNVRVTTDKGSYNYDSRSTGLGNLNKSTNTNHYETHNTYPSQEKVERVDVMCYDR